MGRDLVVIIDEEARKNLKDIDFRYFNNGKIKDDKEYIIETLLGDKKTIKGTLVKEHNLGVHTEEYLYLEITKDCQFSCEWCGAKDHITSNGIEKVIDKEARYITKKFVKKLIKTFKQSGRFKPRHLFYGGGEPLINHKKFGKIHSLFKKAYNTVPVILTNGYSIPIYRDEFPKFLKKTKVEKSTNVFITLSRSHQASYETASSKDFSKGYIVSAIPYRALAEKIHALTILFDKYGLNLKFKALEQKKRNFVEEYIKENFSESYTKEILEKTYSIELNGYRDVCSKGQESGITVDGKFYPHCYDIFKGSKNYLGIVGLLVKEIKKKIKKKFILIR